MSERGAAAGDRIRARPRYADAPPAGGRPRLLFLGQTLPFPPDSGADVRSYNVLRLLAGRFEITALFFFRKALRTPPAVRSALAGLSGLADAEAFAIPQEHGRVRLAWDHARSVLTGRPYTWFTYDAADFRARLRELLRSGRFDLVHVDSLDLVAYLPLLRRLPIVCTHHNVESELLRRRAASSASRLAAAYLRLQASKIERAEREWCPRIALNVTVSEGDRRLLAALAPTARLAVVPNGVDTSLFRPGEEPERGAVFIGAHSWPPNRDAMEYFRDQVLPLILAQRPDFRLSWVGRIADSARAGFALPGMEPVGYVDDVRAHVAGAACYVVPLRAGGGTRLKILEAWAMGKAVVSTSLGCEGLDARDGENILVRDTPESFARAVLSVLEDGDLRRRLGSAARATARRLYDWDVIGAAMLQEYLALLPGGGPGRSGPDVGPER